jgi:hypothetical protein
VVVARAVGEHADALLRRVLALERGDLVGPRQAEVPVGRPREHVAHPPQQGPEVRVGQPAAEADEEQAAQQGQRPEDGLGVGVPQDRLVGADPQHHRRRVLPVPVQVEHPWRVPPEGLLHPRAVAPGHRPQPAGLFEQTVVVGRGERDRQAGQDPGDLTVPQRERADGLAEPPAVLPAVRGAQLRLDLLGHGEELVQVTRPQGGGLALRPRLRGEAEGDAPLNTVLEQAGPGRDRRVPARADGHARAHNDERLALGDRAPEVAQEQICPLCLRSLGHGCCSVP